MILFVLLLIVAFMTSASFHAGCRQGSLTTPKKRLSTEEITSEELDSKMTLGQLTFQ